MSRFPLLTACVLLATLEVVMAGTSMLQAPTKPQVPKQFSSNFVLGTNGLDSKGVFYYDELNSRYFMDISREHLPGYPVKMLSYAFEDHAFLVMNDQCRNSTVWAGKRMVFGPMFSWVLSAYAVYAGKVVIGERTCDEWTLQTSADHKISMCAIGDEPVRAVYPGPSGESVFTWSNIQAGSEMVPDKVFEPPSQCFGEPAMCAPGPVYQEDMYRYHPADRYTLYNQNTADILGDIRFMCVDPTVPTNGKVFSHFQVTVNSTWGQYALCHDRSCVGNVDSVGRAYAFHLGKNSGQCAPANKVGVWWSLPEKTMCAEGAGPEDGTCAWGRVQRVKSVTSKCLAEHGFMEACALVKADPWNTDAAVKVIENALALDESSGGCPDVPPPSALSQQRFRGPFGSLGLAMAADPQGLHPLVDAYAAVGLVA